MVNANYNQNPHVADSILGVVLVTFNSADVVIDALETLFSSAEADKVKLQVTVVDNASSDDTPERILAWRSGIEPYAAPADLPFELSSTVGKPISEKTLNIIRADYNGGFAYGVNIGIKNLLSNKFINRIWVLNPDSIVPRGTVGAFARYNAAPFSLMGGRVLFYEEPKIIQVDGGKISWATGVTKNINHFCSHLTPYPKADDFDFIMGASMVVSREFWDFAGPMNEMYFLYYEEVDWALRRGDLPLAYCPEAIIYHKAGTSIGSPSFRRVATPFSLYFKHRARMLFLRQHSPSSVHFGWMYAIAKATQFAISGNWSEMFAVVDGARCAPPRANIAAKLDNYALSKLQRR